MAVAERLSSGAGVAEHVVVTGVQLGVRVIPERHFPHLLWGLSAPSNSAYRVRVGRVVVEGGDVIPTGGGQHIHRTLSEELRQRPTSPVPPLVSVEREDPVGAHFAGLVGQSGHLRRLLVSGVRVVDDENPRVLFGEFVQDGASEVVRKVVGHDHKVDTFVE